MAANPLVKIYDGQTAAEAGSTTLPAVFTAPIRRDIVHFVHLNMAKNKYVVGRGWPWDFRDARSARTVGGRGAVAGALLGRRWAAVPHTGALCSHIPFTYQLWHPLGHSRQRCTRCRLVPRAAPFSLGYGRMTNH